MKKVRVKLVRSKIGRTDKQKATIEGLGLGKIGSVREHTLTPAIQGMIAKVDFLIKVEEIK
ncbi:MAG: 50S ribosomal protein L30 [Leptospiraceae bacterium]|nr:50S ribosomal protein L30 [Leptospiraceae bacterium]MCB1202053.1 50S ribosomal protein L30 [Leptospiraceae bacterium]